MSGVHSTLLFECLRTTRLLKSEVWNPGETEEPPECFLIGGFISQVLLTKKVIKRAHFRRPTVPHHLITLLLADGLRGCPYTLASHQQSTVSRIRPRPSLPTLAKCTGTSDFFRLFDYPASQKVTNRKVKWIEVRHNFVSVFMWLMHYLLVRVCYHDHCWHG